VAGPGGDRQPRRGSDRDYEGFISPLYLIEALFVITSLEAAELTKYAANAFLLRRFHSSTRLQTSAKIGCDVHDVARDCMDKTDCSKFLHPGPGFEVHAFQKTYEPSSVARHLILTLDC
jgi:UDPglucose 6-dehydrogenase